MWPLFGTLLLFVVLGVVVVVPQILVKRALEREGKWLTFVEFVNGLFTIVAGLASVYVIVVGASQFWDETPIGFLVSAGALAFVIYFYVAKNTAHREARRKTELTPKRAEAIVQQYGAALARGCSKDGIARYESYLPCSKAEIKQAVKVFLACQIEYKSLLKEPTETLLGAVAALNSFLPDDQADRINERRKIPDDPEFWDAMKNVVSFEIREEMDQFIAEVQKWDVDDPLFHQRVYTLIGLEYSPAIEKRFNPFSEED